MVILENGQIIRDGHISYGTIAFDNGILVEPRLADKEDTVIDVHGQYIAPGFIDIHVHGGGGADFMDATVDAFLTVARVHARYGTTTLLPTATSSTFVETKQMMNAFEQARRHNLSGADMPGLHFEGPYFSPAQSGAQDPSQLRLPNPSEYCEILNCGSRILRWSSAPELPGSEEFAKALLEQGILASIGHSDADYDEVVRAVSYGFTHITHLYSCTSTVHRKNAYRYAGIVEAAYLLNELTSEIIADGKHLPPPLLQMVYRFIGPERTALVTDSMRGAGMPDGPTILGSLKSGIAAIIEDGVAKMPDRKAFAGSVATMDLLVRNMVNLAHATLADAVTMASQTPARIVGLTDRGSLEIGKRADIVVLNADLKVTQTIVNGRSVFLAEK